MAHGISNTHKNVYLIPHVFHDAFSIYKYSSILKKEGYSEKPYIVHAMQKAGN
jgi:hypothetical protein